MAADPYRYFRLEAREILDRFGAELLALEKNRGGDVPQLLRLAHTLKGAARIVKQRVIADRAHAVEEALSPFREAADGVPRDRIAAVLQHLDAITGLVDALDAPAAPRPQPPVPQPAAPDPSAPSPPVRTTRAEIAEIDTLRDGLAETHALLNGLRAALRNGLAETRRLAGLAATELAFRREAVSAGQFRDGLADGLRRSVGTIERQCAAGIDRIDRELQQARDAAEQLRLIGADTLFAVLERTARDAAYAMSKEVSLAMRGGDIRLDADVLAAIQAALVQIVRNAVAHGIEGPAERQAAGKSAAGRIGLDIARRSGRIVFTCHDDGRGLDLEAVRQTAHRRGLSAAVAERLGAEQLIDLLLRGGISTAGQVSEIAGRGIGLDVVRETMQRVGGTVAVTTEAGNGTQFELAVPWSLAAIEALLVEAAGTVAAIPLDTVSCAVRVAQEALVSDAAGAMLPEDGGPIPFLWLSGVLGGARLPSARQWPALVVAGSGGRVAVGVERLLGTARTVMHPLPGLAATGAVAAGAALDAEGNPLLVLDPDGLLAVAGRGDTSKPEPEPRRRPVLVVDDSLTTRMLEQSILESAGYEADVAASAEEALETARRKRYGLFLVDVEMPGMDGFAFVERIGADPVLRDIPAILVTSRGAPEDRERGRAAGARGYIVKGEFDQRELLSMIQPLVG